MAGIPGHHGDGLWRRRAAPAREGVRRRRVLQQAGRLRFPQAAAPAPVAVADIKAIGGDRNWRRTARAQGAASYGPRLVTELRDASRSGKPRQQQDEHERRILALDEPVLPSTASEFSAA